MTAALRTSRSMLPDQPMELRDTTTPDHARPLGYLYSTWDPNAVKTGQDDPDMGHYDPDTQTWVDGDVITAGVYTKTQVVTRPNKWEWWWDSVTDDACQ